MESSGFRYSPELNAMSHETEDEQAEQSHVPCLLDIYVHHACNIHNICIYANQDVYAKFSLTSSPDDALSTSVVAGGGKNPRFDERLPPLRVSRRLENSVLKCEIWMRSCAKRFLEDQLLGFALVPLTSVAAANGGSLTQDFTLSSTDLFHSPAGTIRLTIALNSRASDKAFASPERSVESSITSEVVILEPPVDYGRIEFPDLNMVKENQDMVMQYYNMAEPGVPPFLRLGGLPPASCIEDCEMAMSCHEEKSASSDEGKNNARTFTSSTTTTTASDDKALIDSNSSNADEAVQMSACSPGTPTSKSGEAKAQARKSDTEKSMSNGGELGSVFKSPLGGINLEAEQSAMQRQIMDMYMKSMQQFTESLAKMKLPMDLDAAPTDRENDGVVIKSQKNEKLDLEMMKKNKKDGSRVFYGSSAFF